MTSQFNTLSLSDNTENKLLSNLLELNRTSTIDTETYIRINNYYQIGSVDCNFVIKRDNEELLVIDDSNITFKVNIDLDKINVNNEAVLYNTIIENDLCINTSNVNINDDIILSSNSIAINKTTHFNSNIHTDTLYVNNIDNILGCNIIINKLQLNESVFDNPKLLNSVNIIRDTLDSSNIININISNNSNLENILKVADTITINKNGEINIKNNININSNSIYLPDLSIDNKNHLTIGDTKNPVNVVDYDTKIKWENSNNSLLHIHRKDTHQEYNIIKDPLLYITGDYDVNCNIIKTNYNQTELIFSNLELTLSSNITFEDHIIYLDLLPPVQNAIWSSNTTPLVIVPVANDPFLTTSINLHLTHYNYNNYNIFTNECKSTSSNLGDGKIEYTIDVYIGFYKTEDSNAIILDKTNEHKDDQLGYNIEGNLIGCNIGYYNIIENNYSPYDIGSGSIIINFDIHILYEKSYEPEVMYYIDTNPIKIECPLIMHCKFNNNEILTLNSNGLLTIKDLNTLEATIHDLYISNINTSINLNDNDITNVNNLELNNITVDTINATTITTKDINIAEGQTIKFTEIDTSNFNSAFFKYNNTRTNFFNEVTLCDGQIEYEFIKDYRSNNSISGFLISSLNKLSNDDTINSNIAYFDGNVKIIGKLQTNNINTNDTLSIKDHIRITNNVISLGKYLETSTTKNKIWFGNYSNLLDYDQDEANINYTLDDAVIYAIAVPGRVNFDIYKIYYYYFTRFYKDITPTRDKIKAYADTYNINMFGNVRVATINNETILELSDYTDIPYIQEMSNIPKNTMNVYGNIKCCKPFKFTEDTNNATIISDTALTANGNIEIEGNINCDGNIISDGFIKTEAHIEAKKGVRNISDSRVKYDLKKIENAVDKLKSLSGYTFRRKDLNGIKDTGLLAQDVRSVLPEVVNENDEGILSIEYSKMMGLIVEAIKELNVKIDLIK